MHRRRLFLAHAALHKIIFASLAAVHG
jgi:hypothetical protein